MKEIDVLVSKYEDGDTSLAEEKALKQLLYGQSDIKYDSLKKMFEGFDQIQTMQVPAVQFEKNLYSKIRYTGKRVFHSLTFRLASMSIAASVVITLAFVSLSADKEAFVVDKGVRYDDMEKAVGYADEAINQAIAPLQQSMQSLEPIRGLEGTLTPSFSANTNDSNQQIDIAYDSMMKSNY